MVRVWREDNLTILGTTTASIYSTMIITVYVAFSFSDLITYPRLQEYLERKCFFIFLYAGSVAYILFFFYQVFYGRLMKDKTIFYEHDKSHGGLPIRIGALICGLGSFIFYLINMAAELDAEHLSSSCFYVEKLITIVFELIFVILQTIMIFFYPRINLNSYKIINRCGMMHVVSTNITLWIRTLIKESMEEIIEFGHMHGAKHSAENLLNSGNQTFAALLSFVQTEEELYHECLTHDPLADAVHSSSPYLFPFIIEFTLIGASVIYIMSKHIGKKPQRGESASNQIRTPNPIKWCEENDCSRGYIGFVTGLGIMAIAVIRICVFFGLDGREQTEYKAELVSKTANIVINVMGILMLLLGWFQIQKLQTIKPAFPDDILPMDFDIFLLRFSSFFSFLYLLFPIITGLFNANIKNFSNSLHITSGLLEILQIILQLIFIFSLKQKSLQAELKRKKPGRQIVAFLFLFNLAQWVMLTFNIRQKDTSIFEVNFYGFPLWVMIQRITLPMAVFFRFHSSIVSIELFKGAYHIHETHGDDNHKVNDIAKNHAI